MVVGIFTPSPFDWFKQNASRLGGTNQNMVVSWPAGIRDKGVLREQFIHVIDVVPTILEAAGIRAPDLVDGIQQAPIEGTSFAYTFDAQNGRKEIASGERPLGEAEGQAGDGSSPGKRVTLGQAKQRELPAAR